MANILTAILSIKNKYDTSIENVVDGSNRMNNMGEGLETYIKNAFASLFEENNKTKQNDRISEVFSYTGNKNNPPDLMLKGGDAIEVKKIESKSGNIQLNSSHPKDKLTSTNTKISKYCVECEDWKQKDLIYAIGQVPSGKTILKSLWLVMGDCYAAESTTYSKVEDKISEQISLIPDIDLNLDTNELSGVKDVDPLGITYLRVRGMWIINHPSKVFDYLYKYDDSLSFQMISLMKASKYNEYPEVDRIALEADKGISIEDVQVKDPNNPAKLLKGKLITYIEK